MTRQIQGFKVRPGMVSGGIFTGIIRLNPKFAVEFLAQPVQQCQQSLLVEIGSYIDIG